MKLIESKQTLSITIPISLYQKLQQEVGKGKISKFIKETVEEKLQKTEQLKKEEFQKKLIAGYKAVAKNKKIQKEMEVWDETVSDMWRKEEK